MFSVQKRAAGRQPKSSSKVLEPEDRLTKIRNASRIIIFLFLLIGPSFSISTLDASQDDRGNTTSVRHITIVSSSVQGQGDSEISSFIDTDQLVQNLNGLEGNPSYLSTTESRKQNSFIENPPIHKNALNQRLAQISFTAGESSTVDGCVNPISDSLV
ncbi:MAG: hypothetical protein IH840_17610, partial [Candidatus Heimdallarchaeota archaeon]|nr:hypothetical protein [Candidatus Heimdallarchaeota archaeon]